MADPDVLIIGGGVMGMLTALELADAGQQVTLLERRELAAEASWAGGGIVSPLYPWRYRDSITRLASWSQAFYAELSQRLLQETGIDPELRRKGLLMLSVADRDDALAWARQHQRPLESVAPAFVADKEPALPDVTDDALWMPEVASIRNPRLVAALAACLSRNPRITIVQHSPVSRLLMQASGVAGVQTLDRTLRAASYVVTGGAWSADLLNQGAIDQAALNSLASNQRPFKQPLSPLRIEPVKGEMLLFKARPGLLNRVVLDKGRYLIPRNDGRILVGSTLRRNGFEKRTTQEAYQQLYASALAILPALADFPVEVHWAGLRPGSPGGIPYIGAMPGSDNLFVNAGHYRNGLVLAPASCRLLADLLLQRAPSINPAPYRPDAPRPDMFEE